MQGIREYIGVMCMRDHQETGRLNILTDCKLERGITLGLWTPSPLVSARAS